MVTNPFGQIVKLHNNIEGNNFVVDLIDNASGIYYIELISGSEIQTQIISKQ